MHFISLIANKMMNACNNFSSCLHIFPPSWLSLTTICDSYLQILQKAENVQRKYAGQPPLPETLAALESENPGAFRVPTEPSRYDSLLSTAQTHHYCEEIINFGGQDLTKLFLARSAKGSTQ